MFETVVATPLSPGTANSSPMANAPPKINVMNPLRRLRRAFAASTCSDWDDWSELTSSAATPSNAVGPEIFSSPRVGRNGCTASGERSSPDRGDCRVAGLIRRGGLYPSAGELHRWRLSGRVRMLAIRPPLSEHDLDRRGGRDGQQGSEDSE